MNRVPKMQRWAQSGAVEAVTKTAFVAYDPSTDAEMRTDFLDCAGERIRGLAAPIINEALSHLLQPPSLELKGSAIQGGNRTGNLLGVPREQRPVKTYCDLSPVDRLRKLKRSTPAGERENRSHMIKAQRISYTSCAWCTCAPRGLTRWYGSVCSMQHA